ncbi:MAG: HAD-IA family hydrolase [Candidatus Micrarchaeia archaeon]
MNLLSGGFLVKAILFDMDNTLTNFIELKRKASRAAAYAMVDAGLKMKKREAARKLFYAYWKYGIDGNTAFSKFLKEETGKVDEHILNAGIGAYLRAKPKHIKPYPHAKRILEVLKKKYKLGVITDAPCAKAKERLKLLGLLHMFDVIVTFRRGSMKKPHPLPFLRALELLHCKPNEVVMVGDSLPRDIAGAKRVGMIAVYAKYGEDREIKWETPTNVKADFEILSIKELPKILEKIERTKK